MDVTTSCTFCETFQGEMFEANGEVHRYNFCPACGRPYTPDGTQMLNQRKNLNYNEQKTQK